MLHENRQLDRRGDGLTDRQSDGLTDRETKKAVLIFASRNCIENTRRRPEGFQCLTQNKEGCFSAGTGFLAFITTFMCASSLFASYTNVNYEKHIFNVLNKGFNICIQNKRPRFGKVSISIGFTHMFM